MIDNITLDNLHIGCKASNKAEVIAMIGAEFKAKGYGRCEQVPDMRSSYSSGAHPRGTS